MNFSTYQREARRFAQYPEIGDRIIYPTLGLVGEAGEIAEKIKKIFRDNDGEMSDDERLSLVRELGDVVWYVSAIADVLGIRLEDVAWENLRKLRSRKRAGTISGNGDYR